MTLRLPYAELSQLKFADVAATYCQLTENPSTRRAKENDLRIFERFIADRANVDEAFLSDWDRSSTVAFIEDCAELQVAPSTVARRLATLKHLARLISASEVGSKFENPVDDLSIAVPENTPGPLPEDYLAALRRTLTETTDTFAGARRLALCCLFLDAGLKTDEALRLNLSSVCLKTRWLLVVDSGSQRYIPINTQLLSALSAYLPYRASILEAHVGYSSLTNEKKADLPLVIGEWGAVLTHPDSFRLNAKTAFRIVRDAGERAEMSCSTSFGSLSPSVLRDAFVFQLIGAGANPKQIASVLGIVPELVLRYYVATTKKDELKELFNSMS